MARRIDFNMFGKAEKESAGSIVIPETLQFMMSESMLLGDIVQKVSPGVCVFWVSNGNWSMHELLLAMLNITGPADVWMSTYAMNETAERIVSQLKDENVIEHLYCLLDDRVDVRSAGRLKLIRATEDK